jgi:hypothetical protein
MELIYLIVCLRHSSLYVCGCVHLYKLFCFCCPLLSISIVFMLIHLSMPCMGFCYSLFKQLKTSKPPRPRQDLFGPPRRGVDSGDAATACDGQRSAADDDGAVTRLQGAPMVLWTL